ncbi:unnamed protein product [Ilex paraguariensis]|uniref:Transcription repressor n=1 Tax=Ilex paraguariensis TaxID=185542 RepID=A0ABC8RAE5_9AQUA
MEVTKELNEKQMKKKKTKKSMQNWSNRISFSASLPDDVCGVFADSMCAVKYSTDPFSDIRESILEMIHIVGVQDWNDIEELVYCYIVLNSPEIHQFIAEAFLSLCCSVEQI